MDVVPLWHALLGDEKKSDTIQTLIHPFGVQIVAFSLHKQTQTMLKAA